jgi:hypothetical protein
MNYSTAIFLINKDVRAIMVNYEPHSPDKLTMFKTLDRTVKKDDYVVVPAHTRHHMTVSKVIDVDVDVDFDNTTPVEWIVTKVDRIQFEITLSQEGDALAVIKSAEKTKKRNELAAALLVDSRDALKALPISTINGE